MCYPVSSSPTKLELNVNKLGRKNLQAHMNRATLAKLKIVLNCLPCHFKRVVDFETDDVIPLCRALRMDCGTGKVSTLAADNCADAFLTTGGV
jgi:hypothetical protein